MITSTNANSGLSQTLNLYIGTFRLVFVGLCRPCTVVHCTVCLHAFYIYVKTYVGPTYVKMAGLMNE